MWVDVGCTTHAWKEVCPTRNRGEPSVRSYMTSIVRRSQEVLPEAGSFVYLGDFAHVTYAQLEMQVGAACKATSARAMVLPYLGALFKSL